MLLQAPDADDAVVADLSAGRMGHHRSKSGISRPMNEGQHPTCLREAVAGVSNCHWQLLYQRLMHALIQLASNVSFAKVA